MKRQVLEGATCRKTGAKTIGNSVFRRHFGPSAFGEHADDKLTRKSSCFRGCGESIERIRIVGNLSSLEKIVVLQSLTCGIESIQLTLEQGKIGHFFLVVLLLAFQALLWNTLKFDQLIDDGSPIET